MLSQILLPFAIAIVAVAVAAECFCVKFSSVASVADTHLFLHRWLVLNVTFLRALQTHHRKPLKKARALSVALRSVLCCRLRSEQYIHIYTLKSINTDLTHDNFYSFADFSYCLYIFFVRLAFVLFKFFRFVSSVIRFFCILFKHLHRDLFFWFLFDNISIKLHLDLNEMILSNLKLIWFQTVCFSW